MLLYTLCRVIEGRNLLLIVLTGKVKQSLRVCVYITFYPTFLFTCSTVKVQSYHSDLAQVGHV